MIVLDTSFLVAWKNTRESTHEPTKQAMVGLLNEPDATLLLTDAVFSELMTVVASRLGMAAARALGRELIEAPEVQWVPTARYVPEAFTVFSNQAQFRMSLVDCILLVLARHLANPRIATLDKELRAQHDIACIP